MRILTGFLIAAMAAATGPDQIHLAWVEDASTTLTVVWHTAETDNTMHHFARLHASRDAIKVDVFGVKGDGQPPVVQDTFQYNLSGCGSL